MREIDDLPDKPGHLIRLAHQRSIAVFTAAAREFNITALQHILMVALNKYPSIDLSTLAGVVALDRSTTGNVAGRLANRGIVEIAPSADDRRAKVIRLTPEGEKMLDDMVETVQRSQRELLSPLDDAERAEFFRIMRRLTGRSSDRGQSAVFRETAARPLEAGIAHVDQPDDMLGAAVARRLSDDGATLVGAASDGPVDLAVFPRVWSAAGLSISDLGAELDGIVARGTRLAEPGSSTEIVLALVIGEPGEPATPSAIALRSAWIAAAQAMARGIAQGKGRCLAVVSTPHGGHRRRSARSSPSELLATAEEMVDTIWALRGQATAGRGATIVDATGFG